MIQAIGLEVEKEERRESTDYLFIILFLRYLVLKKNEGNLSRERVSSGIPAGMLTHVLP